ncbi:MAG: hypothetical protein M0004_12030 [Actinomycetota bacterium]|nr:hypothetical protein [Actinomycetota bacterium]
MSAAAISVVRTATHGFRVEFVGDGEPSTHHVEVPDGLATRLGWPEPDEDRLVECSFEFLLEREPASSILRRFGLEVIGRYFPEYEAEMRRRAPVAPTDA